MKPTPQFLDRKGKSECGIQEMVSAGHAQLA